MADFNIPNKEEDANRFLQEGYEKQMAGEVDAAIELYRKSLELTPTPEAYTFLKKIFP